MPRKGRILLTTRDPRFLGNIPAAADGLQVKPTTTEEAEMLFWRSVPSHLKSASSQDEEVLHLMRMLGYLPLAIAQAAANITDRQISVPEYISAYQRKKDRMALLEKPVIDIRNRDPPANQ